MGESASSTKADVEIGFPAAGALPAARDGALAAT